MCSMFEDLTKLVKSIEWQVQSKRPETEQTLLNIGNL